jgi:hypothetical protein
MALKNASHPGGVAPTHRRFHVGQRVRMIELADGKHYASLLVAFAAGRKPFEQTAGKAAPRSLRR